MHNTQPLLTVIAMCETSHKSGNLREKHHDYLAQNLILDEIIKQLLNANIKCRISVHIN